MLRPLLTTAIAVLPFIATAQLVFGPEVVLVSDDPQHWAYSTGDLDGDLDLDLLTSSAGNSQVMWYPNNGTGVFGASNVLSTDPISSAYVFVQPIVLNVDGDFDEDVIYSDAGAEVVYWQENLGGGTFAPRDTLANVAMSRLFLADMNADGIMDIVGGGAGWVHWLESSGGGTFTPHSYPAPYATASMAVADLDGDFDLDVAVVTMPISPYFGEVQWLENLGGGVLSAPQIIAVQPDVQHVWALDLENDGDQDLVTGRCWTGGSEVLIYENLGGAVYATGVPLPYTCIFNLDPVDIDSDGDTDLLMFSQTNSVSVLENNGGAFTQVPVHTFGANTGWGFANVGHADLDDDGLTDVLASYNPSPGPNATISWFPLLSTANGESDAPQPMVFPNPAKGDVRLSFALPIDDAARVDLMDAAGRILRTLPGNGTRELVLDRGELAAGLYTVHLTNEGLRQVVARVVME